MKAALVISDRDNVATALEPLAPGRQLHLQGHDVVVADAVAAGHKLALRAIAKGESVVKYGNPIGVATADIAAGAHVHTHNVASARGRGDLAASDPAKGPRLAEPVESTVPANDGTGGSR